MSHTFTNVLTHVICSTKERIPIITPEIKPRLGAYMGDIIRELNGCPLTIDGTADHAHLLVRLPATLALAEALRLLKANSSKWVNETFSLRRKFAWQIGYAGFSVSQSNVPAVVKYIGNQEAHHRRVSFQDELRQYLKKHGIEYDERYIWK
jgi:REP element-mobilizing transposase RayT